MKLEGVRPSNFSGIPLMIAILSLVLILGAMELSYWWMWTVGWIFIFASWGLSAKIENKTLILKYAFGLLPIKLKGEDIEEVLVLNRLEKGVLLRHFPGIGIAYMGVLVYALYRYFALPENLLPGYYVGVVALIVFSSSILISMAVPLGKTSHKLLITAAISIAGASLLWIKSHEVELIPMIVILAMIALWTVYDIDTEDYIVLKTKKGKYLLTSNAPRDKVEKAIKGIMEVLIDD
ncbi:hypothetical protein OCC_11719 [Thermococcus litoralis DSM 5473]|uniref:Uncharacterized protein n=1 Tax=Thermococcus litoralis (strain ATCC 51850 / DSM 5473 / JCM 8560 / NS-C) TaxID=523849 RepID=H3ZNW1_THELN|nr:hypothetical protein [Thermococcus litoralis]EHR78302.1 hypothetical protein OCC_11719 [Thermococcus litoralis DSM 5473]